MPQITACTVGSTVLNPSLWRASRKFFLKDEVVPGSRGKGGVGGGGDGVWVRVGVNGSRVNRRDEGVPVHASPGG